MWSCYQEEQDLSFCLTEKIRSAYLLYRLVYCFCFYLMCFSLLLSLYCCPFCCYPLCGQIVLLVLISPIHSLVCYCSTCTAGTCALFSCINSIVFPVEQMIFGYLYLFQHFYTHLYSDLDFFDSFEIISSYCFHINDCLEKLASIIVVGNWLFPKDCS